MPDEGVESQSLLGGGGGRGEQVIGSFGPSYLCPKLPVFVFDSPLGLGPKAVMRADKQVKSLLPFMVLQMWRIKGQHSGLGWFMSENVLALCC